LGESLPSNKKFDFSSPTDKFNDLNLGAGESKPTTFDFSKPATETGFRPSAPLLKEHPPHHLNTLSSQM